VARDRAMARTVAQAARPGQTVLLVAGAGHVDTSLGVPQHLPRSLALRSLEWPKRPPQKDYCAELRQRMVPAKNQ
jgi:pheromone shutdown protein TraB